MKKELESTKSKLKNPMKKLEDSNRKVENMKTKNGKLQRAVVSLMLCLLVVAELLFKGKY